MTLNDRDSEVGTAAADPSEATRYWSDLMRASASLWQGQFDRWSRALEQMRKGSYGASQYMQDVASTWDAWAMLLASPFQRGSQERQLPTLLFIVDGDAEFVGPADAPTFLFLPLPPGVTAVVTDLYRVGGNGKSGDQTAGSLSIDASKHVRARFSPGMDRVEVSLVDLGRGQSQRSIQGISPGLYVGAIYATEVATRRPLALLYVLVEEPVAA